jgi:nicotinate-nucleotide adenylyltransferase
MAVEALGLQQLLVIPDRIAPHKQLPEGSASPEQRLRMLELALEGERMITVSDLELRREVPSYTYETVEQLHARYPQDQLILLMGTDMFLSFHQWRYPQRILKHAQLGVFYRGIPAEQANIHRVKAEMERQGHTVHLLQNEVVDISSTQLRRMLTLNAHLPSFPREWKPSSGKTAFTAPAEATKISPWKRWSRW